MAAGTTGAARRRYYARHIAHYTKKNNTLIGLGALFLIGMILGAVILRGAGEETVGLLERVVGGFITRRAQSGLSENFFSAFGSSMLFILVLFVSGFCAIAQPVILSIPLIRGLGFGFSAASLYLRYGASATGMVGVLMLPGMLLSTVAILLCCRQSLRLSGRFFAAIRPSPAGSEPVFSLRNYCFGYISAACLVALSAFAEAVLYLAFANSIVLG
ncbi:MAG: hypothetical protein FWE32_02175 [Oscillospiraceae bacterium]|nr:hypothetical protein [Oscillospiraceae bacterium]